MDHITVPDGEIRDAPEVIDQMIKLVTKDRPTPDIQRSESVRRKLEMHPFLDLMVLFNKWSAGERTPIFEQLASELYPV